MSLLPGNAAAAIAAAYSGAIQFPPTGDYPLEFATAYDQYAAGGVVPGAVNSGGALQGLEAELIAAPTTPARLGKALADYWATVALTPDSGNTNVINDALAKESLFVSAVQASLTASESNPPFEQFIRNVETTAVKSVVWTVTASDGSTTMEGIT